MQKKYISIILSLYLCTGCSNKVIKQEKESANVTQENQTIKESSLLGKILVGTLTFLGTKGNLQKTFEATKFGGNASGYFVGKKLSDIQKKYKDKEEVLISQIIQIDEESTDLQTKNTQLNNNLLQLEENIKTIENNKILKESEKKSQQLLIRKQLKKEKEKFKKLLSQNHKLSQKISFSKEKTNEYNYSKEDKRELLESVSFLEKNTQSFEKKITQKLNTVNSLIATI